MSDKSKIGLIGTGRIDQVHAANVASLAEITLRWLGDPLARATEQKRECSRATVDPPSPGAAKDGSIDVDPNA
jgi:hypothetical protein